MMTPERELELMMNIARVNLRETYERAREEGRIDNVTMTEAKEFLERHLGDWQGNGAMKFTRIQFFDFLREVAERWPFFRPLLGLAEPLPYMDWEYGRNAAFMWGKINLKAWQDIGHYAVTSLGVDPAGRTSSSDDRRVRQAIAERLPVTAEYLLSTERRASPDHSAFSAHCPSCGKPVQSSWQYCMSCGARLG